MSVAPRQHATGSRQQGRQGAPAPPSSLLPAASVPAACPKGEVMTEHQIDLKALLVEKPDCDAGTVQQLRNALAQGGNQYRTLRDVTQALEKKLESATG